MRSENKAMTGMVDMVDASETAKSVGVTPVESRRWVRYRLGAGLRFARHLVEMMIGMAILGAIIAILGEPPGFDSLLMQYGLMGISMSVPMVAWMRYRGHSRSDGGEMVAAMLLPMFALVVPVELGVMRMSEESLMLFTHIAMIAGMVALMFYRFDRYAHKSQAKHT